MLMLEDSIVVFEHQGGGLKVGTPEEEFAQGIKVALKEVVMDQSESFLCIDV